VSAKRRLRGDLATTSTDRDVSEIRQVVKGEGVACRTEQKDETAGCDLLDSGIASPHRRLAEGRTGSELTSKEGGSR
jgi:hypothetical protein